MNSERMIERGVKLFGWAAVAAFVVLLPNVVRAEGPEVRAVTADVDIACDGDFDGDGDVDAADLAILLGGYGYCRNCAEDINGDRRVDDGDLEILARNWGECGAAVVNTRKLRAVAPRNEILVDDRDIVVEASDEEREVYDHCPADLDGDGEVGAADLSILLAGYGKCRDCGEDFDADYDVDDSDLDFLIRNWGTCPSTRIPVPEICSSDFDKDGEVGAADLAVLLGRYGQRDQTVDLNGDSFIDDTDVDILLTGWGPCE